MSRQEFLMMQDFFLTKIMRGVRKVRITEKNKGKGHDGMAAVNG